jgi:hypothetical protein
MHAVVMTLVLWVYLSLGAALVIGQMLRRD